ncbi:Bor/Iss family lipoprotein [Francisella sciaenopsi]|uniref:Bor protein n=1 Tax=Francisella sciaenopsi TaxID=3055034 RepID=A0ABQ6PDX1_9GAMM
MKYHILKYTQIFLVGFSLFILCSCADQSVTFKKIPADKQPIIGKVSNIYILGGLGQTSEVVPADICGGHQEKVAKVTFTKPFIWDGLISLITLGIITPRHTYVYCV